MVRVEGFIHRKTIPETTSNRGVVHHESEVPSVGRSILSELNTYHSGKRSAPTLDGAFKSGATTLSDRDREITASELIPLIKLPLLPPFVVGWGGGRTYGGGRSKEALRRAKEHNKHHRYHLRKNPLTEI